MSLPSNAAESGVALPSSALHQEAITEVFAHLDNAIEHATKAQRHSQHVGDDRAVNALDDALSLLDHVRSRLRYDLAPELDQDFRPTV